MFAASGKCEILQDQDDKDIRRLLLTGFLTTRRCSRPRSLPRESYLIFHFLVCVCISMQYASKGFQETQWLEGKLFSYIQNYFVAN